MREATDTSEQIERFINSGKNANNESSRTNWGKIFLNFLTERKKSWTLMKNKNYLNDELVIFYYSLKKRNGEPYQVPSLRSSIGPLSAFLSKKLDQRLSIQNDFEFQKTRDCLIALF